MLTISNKSYLNPFQLKSYGIDQYFSAEIYSFQVGCSKPGKKIFSLAEELLEIKPNEIIHVGDSIKADIIGAKSMGWKTVLIRRKHNNFSSNNLKYEKADFVISELGQVLSVINNL